MQQKNRVNIAISILIIFLMGCTSAPVVEDNRSDEQTAAEQRANAQKAQQELSQEINKTK